MTSIQCPACSKWTPNESGECLACGHSLLNFEPRAQRLISERDEYTAAHVHSLPTPNTSDSEDDAAPEAVPSATASPLACPKCRSTQLTANKKGFGLRGAIVGGLVAGPVGLLGGFVGAGKVKITCLQCGHSWEAGKRASA